MAGRRRTCRWTLGQSLTSPLYLQTLGLPDAYQARLRAAGQAARPALATEVEHTYPEAVPSPREGHDETLTVRRRGCATGPGWHAARDQRHRVDDLDLR
jgi:putative transposase